MKQTKHNCKHPREGRYYLRNQRIKGQRPVTELDGLLSNKDIDDLGVIPVDSSGEVRLVSDPDGSLLLFDLAGLLDQSAGGAECT
jgi:hypothetical protein